MKVSRPVVCGQSRDLTGQGRVRWLDGELVPVGEGEGIPTEEPGMGRHLGPAPKGLTTEAQVRRVFEVFREHGLEPHPFDDDGEAARRFLGQRAVDVRMPQRPSEENVSPNRHFGFCNPRCTVEDPSDEPISIYSDYLNVVADIAATGAGLVRHVNQPDPVWFNIFDQCDAYDPSSGRGDAIPPPRELYEGIVGADRSFPAFSHLTSMLIACLRYGVRMIPVLFAYGGGTGLEDPEILTDVYGDEVSKSSIRFGKPDHENGPMIVAERGWDPFYWDFDGPALTLQMEHERNFQRFALNVWVDSGSSSYMREAARRKSLAIAAFGMAVGDYLARVGEVLEALGTSIRDLIPWVEYGNELDGDWCPHSYNREEYEDHEDYDTTMTKAAQEMGRFCALLGGPIHRRCPDMHFRFPDLAGWNPASTLENKRKWVKRSIVEGMTAETERWDEMLQLYDTTDLAQLGLISMTAGDWTDWILSMISAGVVWPEPGAPIHASDLVHLIGCHVFRGHTHQCTSDNGLEPVGPGIRYADEPELATEMRAFAKTCDAINDEGFHVQWSIGALSFPAVRPGGMVVEDRVFIGRESHTEDYTGPTPSYQAGILARRMIYLHALGPKFILWYTYDATA